MSVPPHTIASEPVQTPLASKRGEIGAWITSEATATVLVAGGPLVGWAGDVLGEVVGEVAVAVAIGVTGALDTAGVAVALVGVGCMAEALCVG